MLDTTIHQKEMLNIILQIYKQPRSKFVAFKGGTMCYFLHQLDRFSTDLDFDILDKNKKDEIMQEIGNILMKYGNIKNETKGQLLHRYIYRYDHDGHNIKIECSTQVSPYNTYEQHAFLGINILKMTTATAFANKLCALSQRVANRDLYDVRWMNTNKRTFDPKIIQEQTGLTMHDFFSHLHVHISQHFQPHTILGQLGVVLNETQKREVKKNLINDVLEIVELWKGVYR